MTESRRAIFLSYASQDAEAARHIVDTLRSAGIEVWFDQSELRGGDAWDRQISKQIRECALFIALVSAHTDARAEGYFRREWRIAVDRTRDMADDEAFLLPIVIDDTPDATARVPDKFREVQWTRLPGGVAPEAFAERLERLLAPHEHDAPTSTRPLAGAVPVTDGLRDSSSSAYRPAKGKFAATWRSRPVLLLAAAVVIAFAYFLVDRIVLSKRVTEAAKPSAPLAREVSPGPILSIAIPEKSIAVLPFVDMSEKKDQEYFSDGLAEELLDLLAQVPDLRVPARTSSFYFKGKSDDIASIAQKLRVAHVLEGSVRKAGNTIRVTAQLIRADNGYHLWSKTYDRGIKDIFKVQDEIAAAVVDALKARLLPAQQISSRHRTDNTEAYTEYLLGTQFRARDTPAANRQALAAYQKAVALDPGYAAAYSGISGAEWRIADQSIGEAAAYQRAGAAAEKAIALAPDSPEGYWARGLLRNSYYFDWHGADVDFQKALALDANFVPAYVDYAYLLATLGRSADAIALLHKSLALDPLSVPAWHALALLLVNTGQLSDARAAARRLADVNPGGNNGVFGADADLFDARTREALEGYRRELGPLGLMGEAMAEHTLGNAAESQRALDKLIETAADSMGYQIADVYAWRRENDKAFEWLERSYQRHDGGLGYVTYDRYLANLRTDPRYMALLRKLKLSE